LGEIVKRESFRPTVAIGCQIGVLAALVTCALPAARSSAALLQRQAIHPQTLLTTRHPISYLFIAGTRVAFFEQIQASATRSRWDVDVWSRQTKALRRFRMGDSCGDRLALAGRDVYWECDQFGASISRARLWLGAAGRRPLLLAAGSEPMSLASDGQLAVFLRGPFLWRLEGKRKRVLARGPNGDGEIIDLEAGRILIWRSHDGRIVLLDRTGAALHLFSRAFECCINEAYALAGSKLVRLTEDAIDVYDSATEAPVHRFPIDARLVPVLDDAHGDFAVYSSFASDQSFHVLNMRNGRDTVISARRWGSDSGAAAGLGRDGIYYEEAIRGRGRLQFVPYKQLRP
jgi:hypothetical protein